MSVNANYRLERIADEICSCELTDGFCGPRNRPGCRCWKLARLAIRGLRTTSNPALRDAWPEYREDDMRDEAIMRGKLDALCNAILNKRDELTVEHEGASQMVG